WRRTAWSAPGSGWQRETRSPPRLLRGPVVALDEDLAIRRHARLGEAHGAAEPELHAHHLLDPVFAEVRVLGRERGLRIHAQHVRLDRLRRRRGEEDARRRAPPYH